MAKGHPQPRSEWRGAGVPNTNDRTDAQIVPATWNIEKISAIAEVKTGPFGSTLHERDYVESGTPIVTVEHLSERGILHRSLPLVSDSDRLRLKSYSLRAGDIVFSRVGSVDRNALVRKGEEGWLFSGRLLRVRMASKLILPAYLSYYFHSEHFRRRIREVAVGQTMASLNTRILEELQVAFPSLPEQHAVVGALSDVDGLLQVLEALIAKKRAVKRAAIQQLLTGKTRLPGFIKPWRTVRLADVGVLRAGTGFPLSFQGRQSGDYQFFKVSDLGRRENEIFLTNANHWIDEGTRSKLGATRFAAGSIVFAKIGAAVFLERKRRLLNESCLDNNMMAFTLTAKDVCGTFVYYSFLRIELGKLVSATALPSLPSREVGALRLSLPPVNEQHAIVTVLSDMDAEIAAFEQRLDKTRAVKHGMMQQLLTGRVRLVEPEVTAAR